uniref:Coilin p80 n=1 Tax=Echeneis naucrates TaxID=173247 RepID=A0A665UAR8_ECHNA
MAANANSCIRVRLYFDYPPPAVIDCRMCWLLVDLNKCRVVADLESIIREKFEFSSRSILNLFIEDCYLPHTEHIYVVRDNDSVRVKVKSVAQVNRQSRCSDASSKNCRKRQRPAEEDGPRGNIVNEEWKKKKRKKHSKEGLLGDDNQASVDEQRKKSHEKDMKKRKKIEESSSPPPKTTPSAKKNPKSDKLGKSTTKPTAAAAKTHNVSSSDSSSSSSEDGKAPKKTPTQKHSPKVPSSTLAASKAHANSSQTKSHPTSSSSSETDSSCDETPTGKAPSQNKPQTSTSSQSKKLNDNSKSQQDTALQSTNCAHWQATTAAKPLGGQSAVTHDSDSDEIQLVIRKPLQQQWQGLSMLPYGRGSNQRGARRGGPENKGRGRGKEVLREKDNSFEVSYNGANEPSYQTDSLTNTSVVIQNGPESASKQDYSSLPLLAAPPQVGQKIAFKVSLPWPTEGKIVNFNPTTKQIELELLHVSQAPVEPGKFDLVYQNPDGSERVEYAVTRGAWVSHV